MTVNIPISKSWRTSSGGILALLASASSAAHLIHSGNYNFSDPTWTAALAGIASGLALLFARDNKVSSEDAGIKPPENGFVALPVFPTTIANLPPVPAAQAETKT